MSYQKRMTVAATLLALVSAIPFVVSGSDAPSGPPTNASATNSLSEPTQSTPSSMLTPIDRPSPDSTTFQLVDDVPCNANVSDKIYVLYDKNRALFDHCVSDAAYHIFPYLGVKPTATQVHNMATSPSCVAVLTGVLFADLPQCTISGFALKAAAETLLKIHVDLMQETEASPSAMRFRELMAWRQWVNLAKEAGAPYDSNSILYREYERNLDMVRCNSSIRMLADYQIEYKVANGSWTDADGEAYADRHVKSKGTDDDEFEVGTVSPGKSDAQVSDSDARYARNHVAPIVVGHGVMSTVVGLFLGLVIHMAR
ncbi:hypothetical protein PsorP6_019612 [Peronosclerospora sorghi]|nr:hypothetical protein PsorP6_019612 [Peronosclerospora sorghi]